MEAGVPAPAAWFQALAFNHRFTRIRVGHPKPLCSGPFGLECFAQSLVSMPRMFSSSLEHLLPLMLRRKVVQLPRGSVNTKGQVLVGSGEPQGGDQNPPLCCHLTPLPCRASFSRRDPSNPLPGETSGCQQWGAGQKRWPRFSLAPTENLL